MTDKEAYERALKAVEEASEEEGDLGELVWSDLSTVDIYFHIQGYLQREFNQE